MVDSQSLGRLEIGGVRLPGSQGGITEKKGERKWKEQEIFIGQDGPEGACGQEKCPLRSGWWNKSRQGKTQVVGKLGNAAG